MIKYDPSRAYQGVGGYSGYLVFEFGQGNLYVFESIMYGNATYIFENEWEEVSKLTKKEIIENQLAVARIIHNQAWSREVNRYLRGNGYSCD